MCAPESELNSFRRTLIFRKLKRYSLRNWNRKKDAIRWKKRKGRENKTLPLTEGFIQSKKKWEGVGLMLRGRDARSSVGGPTMWVGWTEIGKGRGDEEGQGGERQESRRLVGNVA